jgi:Fur family ferric uptake transcriptional regulator
MTDHSPAERTRIIARAYGGGRASAQRLAVARAAERAGRAFTIRDLAALAREEDPRISTATVYRCVAAMAAAGHLSHVGERGGAALWARCDAAEHHHHLVCTACGATAYAECPIDEQALAAAAPDGFTVTSHDVRLYGLCATCSQCAGRAGS